MSENSKKPSALKYPLLNISIMATLLAGPQAVYAFSFELGNVEGVFDSTLGAGSAVRMESQSKNLVSPVSGGSTHGNGRLGQGSGLNDQGNLNYDKGDAFTTYIKGTHELLLKVPGEGLTFMARGTWLSDASAQHVTGNPSGMDPYQAKLNTSDGLSDDARDQLRFQSRLLDLWVSKSFDIGEELARVRVGNQVISWGENIYEVGGINSINAMDINRASQPGAQMKEFVLPAPIVSFATGLGYGFNLEAYVQTNWVKNYLPPVGSYFSTSVIGEGMEDYGTRDKGARDSGQYGLALRYQPQGTDLNLGLYVMSYHDKFPQTQFTPEGLSFYGYPEDRILYGVSANLPMGDVAVGTELSYRPRDAVPLNPGSGCVAQKGECWVDEEKWQWHVTTIYSLTPGGAGAVLDLLGADSATLTTESVVIGYPTLKDEYNGSPISSGGVIWGNERNDLNVNTFNNPEHKGSRYSGGVHLDFNWVYDGTLISGWQVTPGVYMKRGLFGYTPSITQNFMKDVTAMSVYTNFVHNASNWVVGLNYTSYSGPSNPLVTPLRDRDFLSINVSRSF